MSSARAYLAALGTSLSLVVAGTIALLALSTFVAFHGWPGISDGGRADVPDLVVSAAGEAPGTQGSAVAPQTAPLVLGSRASAPATAPARQGTLGARERSGTAPAPDATATPNEGASASPGNGQSTTAPPPATPTRPKAGDLVRNTGSVVADTTRDVTGTAGHVLTPVSPDAGAAVEQTGDTVAGTVGTATKTIAGAVDGLVSTPK
jgi:hypothetical protein